MVLLSPPVLHSSCYWKDLEGLSSHLQNANSMVLRLDTNDGLNTTWGAVPVGLHPNLWGFSTYHNPNCPSRSPLNSCCLVNGRGGIGIILPRDGYLKNRRMKKGTNGRFHLRFYMILAVFSVLLLAAILQTWNKHEETTMWLHAVSIYLSIYLIYLSIYLIYISIYLSTYLPIYLSIYFSIYLSIYIYKMHRRTVANQVTTSTASYRTVAPEVSATSEGSHM